MTPPILAGYCPQAADRGPVSFAAAAARFTGAPLIVTAIHSGGAVLDHLAGGELAERPATEAQEMLERLGAELGDGGLDLHVRLREAITPAAGLTAAIEETKPALVVLGSTHRGPVGRVLLGSTAERVIHGAACPVAVVPHGYEARSGGVATIGAAFSPTPEGREALRVAALLAGAAGARVRAVMVLDPRLAEHQSPGLLALHHHERGPEDEAGRLRLEAERTLEKAIAALPSPADIEPDVLFQVPADGLAAASEHLDLLVMGSRAYGPARAVMLGGVSRRVITRAACPVLVLPRGTRTAIDSLLPSAGAGREPAGR